MQESGHEKSRLHCDRGEFNLGQRNGSAGAIGRRGRIGRCLGRNRRGCRYVRRSATVIVSKFPVDIDEPVHLNEPINFESAHIDESLDIRAFGVESPDIDQSFCLAIIHRAHDARCLLGPNVSGNTRNSTWPVELVSVHHAPNITNNTQLAVEHVTDDARLTKLEHSG
jgi:hypothetical protein